MNSLKQTKFRFIEQLRPELLAKKLGTPFWAATLLLALLVLGQLWGCERQVDWITYRGFEGSGATSNALYPPLGQRWKLRLQSEGTEARSFNPPIIKGETVYFGSSDKNFYALDSNSGYMRWIFPTKNKVNSVPYIYEDTVYFGSNDGNLYAVNIENGQELWSFSTGRTVQSLVARYEDNVIFTSDLGATYFLDPNGKVKNKLPNPTWSHHTFQVYEGVLYWAPRDRGFGAYDIRRRRFLWHLPVRLRVPSWYSFPAIDQNKVYFGRNLFTGRGSGARLTYFALDRHKGRTIWKKDAKFQWSPHVRKNSQNVFYRHIYLLDYMAPSLWKDLVIYTSGDRMLRAFKRDNGDLAWEKSFEYHTSSAPTIAGDRLYLGIHGSELKGFKVHPPKLLCLNARNGKLLWEMELEGAVLSAPVISGKQMLFGTDKSRFYILEEIF